MTIRSFANTGWHKAADAHKQTLAHRRSYAPYVSPVFKTYIVIDFDWLGAAII